MLLKAALKINRKDENQFSSLHFYKQCVLLKNNRVNYAIVEP